MSLREKLIEAGQLTPADREYPHPFSRTSHFQQYNWDRPSLGVDALARTRAHLIKTGFLKSRRLVVVK